MLTPPAPQKKPPKKQNKTGRQPKISKNSNHLYFWLGSICVYFSIYYLLVPLLWVHALPGVRFGDTPHQHNEGRHIPGQQSLPAQLSRQPDHLRDLQYKDLSKSKVTTAYNHIF